MLSKSSDESALYWRLFALGRWHAARRGLIGEEGEDCAGEFLLYLLPRVGATTEPDEADSWLRTAVTNPAWLHRQARTYTRNFQRAVVARSSRHCSDVSDVWKKHSHVSGEQSEVEASVLRSEFWQHIQVALDSLETVPRQLLIGRQFRGESIETLAASCGRSCHAVEQTLVRARHQIRRILERRGCTESILREYVAALATHQRPM